MGNNSNNMRLWTRPSGYRPAFTRAWCRCAISRTLESDPTTLHYMLRFDRRGRDTFPLGVKLTLVHVSPILLFESCRQFCPQTPLASPALHFWTVIRSL